MYFVCILNFLSVSRLGVGESLGGEAARTVDPKWSEG